MEEVQEAVSHNFTKQASECFFRFCCFVKECPKQTSVSLAMRAG